MDQKHGSADAGEAPMKHPRRGRAKFRVGQVVRFRDGSYGRLETPAQASPLQSTCRRLFSVEGYVYAHGSKEEWYHISELRLLTAREKGSPMTVRRANGQFDYQDFTRMCRCGHRLGVHAGENETHTRPCFNEDAAGGGTGEPCTCKNFDPKRRAK